MRIIGIDPGSRLTGWGVLEQQAGRLIHVDCGVIAPPAKASLPNRLLTIAEGLEAAISEHRPEAAAVEDVFYSRNWRSALKLGQARGVVLATLARHGLEVAEYPPTLVKQSVVGFGRADKNQVQQMVRVLLGLPEIPQEDAADALAVAICYTNGSAAVGKGWR